MSGKFILMSWNPDSYIDRNSKINIPPIDERLLELEHTINHQIERIDTRQNHALLEIHYLHSDEFQVVFMI